MANIPAKVQARLAGGLKKFQFFYLLIPLFLITLGLNAQEKKAIGEDTIVYVTKTGKKYHTSSCYYFKNKGIPIKLSEAKNKYSPCAICNPLINKSSIKETTDEKKALSNDKKVETTATGKVIYTGPRGGKYHYSKNGKKVYERKKK